MPDDFKDLNQVTRRGTGWRNFAKGAPQSTMEFSDGAHNCLAVERLGPPWHGGYVWVVHASICREDADTAAKRRYRRSLRDAATAPIRFGRQSESA
jgi:hypothetical protein